MADHLARMLDNLSLQHFDERIRNIVYNDTMMIVDAYNRETCDLSDSIPRFWVNSLGSDLALQNRFYDIYTDESVLYEDIVSILRHNFGTSFLVEMMPLIDDYIEFVFLAV
jgi:hypothetical protein